MPELEPLPTDIQQLLEGVRPLQPPPPGMQEKILAKVHANVHTAAASSAVHSATSAISGSSLKTALVFALGVGAGAIGHHMVGNLQQESFKPAPVVHVEAVTEPVIGQPETAGQETVDEPPARKPSREAGASTATQAPPQPPQAPPAPAASVQQGTELATGTLATEQRLLEAARSALLRDRPGAALEALEEHATRFAQGRHAEDREALIVHTLVLLGERGAAEQRAQGFYNTYPNSLLKPMVDAALVHSRL